MNNMLNDSLKETFGKAKESHGELYFPEEIVMDLIAWCDRHNIAILGIEGFEWSQGRITPKLDLIADYSSLFNTGKDWVEIKNRSVNLSKSFVELNKLKENNLFFNFTFREFTDPEKKAA